MPADTPEQDTAPAVGAATKKREINRVPWWTYAALWPLAQVIRLWLRSLRMRTSPETIAAIAAERGPVIVCFWHNRLIIAPELRRRFRSFQNINALVSASKDGAWLVALFNLLDVGAVRGSSSWRGGQALVELSRKLRAGEGIGITPDGPRGPCYDFKKGPAAIALASGCPVFLVGSKFHKAKRLKSWDGFLIPYPFSKIELTLDIVRPEGELAGLSDVALADQLRARLLALTDDEPAS